MCERHLLTPDFSPRNYYGAPAARRPPPSALSHPPTPRPLLTLADARGLALARAGRRRDLKVRDAGSGDLIFSDKGAARRHNSHQITTGTGAEEEMEIGAGFWLHGQDYSDAAGTKSHELEHVNTQLNDARFLRQLKQAEEADRRKQSEGAAGASSAEIGSSCSTATFFTGDAAPKDSSMYADFAASKKVFADSRKKATIPLSELNGDGDDPEWMGTHVVYKAEDVRASLGAFRGAAGSTTHAMEKRLQAERGESAARKPLLKENSEIDAIVFGYDMDNSSADDAVEDALYAGMFGTRSRCFNPGTDMATRSTAHTTGEQVYGAHISGGAIRDVQPTKPYVTDGVAGKTTQEIAKFDGQLICITNRPLGIGSSVVNPTEADKLVLGFDIDASQPDRRDFEGSAGGGAHGMQRPVGSIDHVEKRKMIVEPHETYDPRFGPRAGKVGAIETDFSHGTRSTMTIARARQQDGYAGEEYNATRGQHTRASVMDMGAMHAAGIDRMLVQDYGMPDADGHYYNLEYAGKHTKDLAADRGYMTVKEKDHVGSHDVATHPAFRGTAGLPQGADEMTAGKRALPLEMVSDPHTPHAETAMQNAFERPGGERHLQAQAARVIHQMEADPVAARNIAAHEAKYTQSGYGGVTSDKLARMRGAGDYYAGGTDARGKVGDPNGGGRDALDRDEVGRRLAEAHWKKGDEMAAGAPGSPAVKLAESRKGTVATRPSNSMPPFEEQGRRGGGGAPKDGRRDFGGSIDVMDGRGGGGGGGGSLDHDHVARAYRDRRQRHFDEAAGRDSHTDSRAKNYMTHVMLNDLSLAGDRCLPHTVGQAGKEIFGLPDRTGNTTMEQTFGWDGERAGMGSSPLQGLHTHSVWGNESHGRRKLGAGANSGVVDSIVFGHDLDQSDDAATLTEHVAFAGAKGLTQEHLADMAARNDSQLRMHLEHAPGKRTTGSVVKHNRDGLMKAVVFSEDGNAAADHEARVLAARKAKEQKLRGGEQSRKLHRLQTCTSMKPTSAAKADPLKLDDEQDDAEDAFAGAAGSSSQAINHRQYAPAKIGKSNLFNAQQATIDEMIYGHDLDPEALSEEEKYAMQMADGLAGQSSIDRNIKDQLRMMSGRKQRKGVPHQQPEAHALITPGNEKLVRFHADEDARHQAMNDTHGVAGQRTELVTGNREITQPQRLGGNGGKGIRGGTAGAAGLVKDKSKREQKESMRRGSADAFAATKGKSPSPNSKKRGGGGSGRSPRAAGRPLGESPDGVGSLLGEYTGQAEYEQALEQGRAAIASGPYMASPESSPDPMPRAMMRRSFTAAWENPDGPEVYVQDDAAFPAAMASHVKTADDATREANRAGCYASPAHAAGGYKRPEGMPMSIKPSDRGNDKQTPWGSDRITAEATQSRFQTVSGSSHGASSSVGGSVFTMADPYALGAAPQQQIGGGKMIVGKPAGQRSPEKLSKGGLRPAR